MGRGFLSNACVLLLQVNLKMREITEKEVKLKQQLLDSPAHQKVKAGPDARASPVGRGPVVLPAASSSCSLGGGSESPAPPVRGGGHGGSPTLLPGYGDPCGTRVGGRG